MKRFIIKFFGVIAATSMFGLGLTSCTQEDFEAPAIESTDGSVLELYISRSTSTRVAAGTEFTVAEKVVKSVDLFFYEIGASDTSEPIHYVRVVPVMNRDEATSNQGKITTSVPAEVLGKDSGQRTECKVYAVVNTDVAKDQSAIELGKLKALKASSPGFMNKLLKDETAPKLVDDKGNTEIFNGFVMFTMNPDGDIISYDSNEEKVTGTITVTKLASKIDIFLGYGENGGPGDECIVAAVNPNDPGEGIKKWKRYNTSTNATEAYIVNGVQSVRIGGSFDQSGDFIKENITSDDYFDLWEYDENTGDEGDDGNENASGSFSNYARHFRDNVNEANKATYPYVVEAPFYTYPNQWNTDVTEQHRTYLILKVNWLEVDDQGNPIGNLENLLETYYMVPMNVNEGDHQNKILNNCYYQVKVKINSLGGQHFGEPLMLDDCSYEILDWGTANLDAKLRETRYFEVRQESDIPIDPYDYSKGFYTAVMNNIDQITIPFYSSHKVEIESVNIEYFSYANPKTNEASASQDLTYDFAYVKETDIDLTTPEESKKFLLKKEDIGNGEWQGAYIDDQKQTITIQHYIGVKGNSTGPFTHTTYGSIRRNNRTVTADDMWAYTPYVITIVLRHTDNKQDEKQTIRVKHYPAIYIEGDVNKAYNLVGQRGAVAGQGWNYEYDMYDGPGTLGMITPTMYFFGFVRINNNAVMRKITANNSNPAGQQNQARENYDAIRKNAFGGSPGIDKKPFSLSDLWSGKSDNPCFYVINTTQLSDEFKLYHIKDPRKNNSNTRLDDESMNSDIESESQNGTWQVEGRHIDGGRSKLTYYYPTNESMAEEDMYAISPKFRVATSFGAHDNAVDWETARKRCASYSEYGYPAGRWRLPTLGEMQFVAALSNKGIVPALFGGRFLWFNIDVTYWSAQGPRKFEDTPEGKLQNTTTAHVRCVYDDWYWTKDKNGGPDHILTQMEMYNDGDSFIWGDRPKNNPQVQPKED